MGCARCPAVVPEMIDLAEWRRLLAGTRRKLALHGALRGPLYRRKRVAHFAAGGGGVARNEFRTRRSA